MICPRCNTHGAVYDYDLGGKPRIYCLLCNYDSNNPARRMEVLGIKPTPKLCCPSMDTQNGHYRLVRS